MKRCSTTDPPRDLNWKDPTEDARADVRFPRSPRVPVGNSPSAVLVKRRDIKTEWPRRRKSSGFPRSACFLFADCHQRDLDGLRTVVTEIETPARRADPFPIEDVKGYRCPLAY